MDPLRKTYKDGFYIDLVDYYSEYKDNGWYLNGEKETEDWMVDNIKHDWVCLDVGAHIGYYSMLMSHLAPDGYVYAIEGYPDTCRRFQTNYMQSFDKTGKNIKLINAVVGDKCDRCQEVFWFTGLPGNGRTEGEYTLYTLDELFLGYLQGCTHGARLDLLKIDVDGWDYEVLLGSVDIIKRFKPYIVAEVSHALGWRNHSSQEVEYLLDKLNYTYSVLDKDSPNNWLCMPQV